MRRICLLVNCSLLAIAGFGQKPTLDTSILFHWPWVRDNGVLSADGNYVGFGVEEEPRGSRTYYLKGTYTSWEKKLAGIDRAEFSIDSRYAVYLEGDTLHLVALGTDDEERIPRVSSYQLFKKRGEEYLLFYSKSERQLSIRGSNGKQDDYSDIDAWLLAANGQALFKKAVHDKDHQSISLVNLQNKEEQIIWQGGMISDWLIDNSGDKIVFTIKDQNETNQIWYYKGGKKRATLIANDHSGGIGSGVVIGKLLKFSNDGRTLLFDLRKELAKPDSTMVSLDVWTYRDEKLQSTQLKENASKRDFNYLTLIKLDSNFMISHLQKEDETLSKISPDGNYVLFNLAKGDLDEMRWSIAAQKRYDLVNVTTGRRTKVEGYGITSFSPGGRFLGLYNTVGDLFSCELATGIIRSLTAKVSLSINKLEHDSYDPTYRALPIGWLPGDSGVLACDDYDLWVLDPFGKKAPINLTQYEGAKTKRTFTPAVSFPGRVITGDTLILCAFDHNTKENGFYRIVLNKSDTPERLINGPYAFYKSYPSFGRSVIKAAQASVFLVSRESISESPNYFVTKDFRSFTPISRNFPEKDYNWTRSKLVNFKTTDERNEQGVLYMPGDFDPNRKYPLIVHYYERLSHLLNSYHSPLNSGLGLDNLGIAWFTSRGYLVFTPDFHYEIGKTGDIVLQTVMGAIKLLRTLPFVDGKHMGLQGYSFGGWETNYLVTHTHVFAAALSSAAVSDFISNMSSEMPSGPSPTATPDFQEYGQHRMGTLLWERPDNYIRNSPIYYADKVTTPLLIIANKNDYRVPFTQGLEFFTALRRLGKKVWMLQYDGGDHGQGGARKEEMDYLLRSTQFFDHYLKGMPAPKWMVEGIPASKKQIDDGFELEPPGIEPGPGLLTPEAQKKVDALKHKKPITVTFY